MRSELAIAEAEHEEHASALRANSMGDMFALEKKLEEARARHKHEATQLTSELIREKRKVADASERINELEKKVANLQEENARLEGTWRQEVMDLKNNMSTSAASKQSKHASEMARLEASLLRVTNEKEALDRRLAGSGQRIEELMGQMENSERAAQLRLDEAVASGKLEAARLQREIDKSKALHTAALAAGSYKGRQLLYLDSMKGPTRKGAAQDESSISWRGLEEIHSLTKAMVGESEAARMRKLAEDVGGTGDDVPSGFVPNPSYEALGERFGSGTDDREIVNRMLQGDYSSATGLVSHVHPSARNVMAQSPGRVLDVP